jgi:metal-responsive CopG/Arc/MetJ family transcriptional regulator
MNREMSESGRENVSEFIKDAVKFYIRDSEDRRTERRRSLSLYGTMNDVKKGVSEQEGSRT